MALPLTIIERAFQLAQAGSCTSMDDITRTLKREQFEGVDAQLGGRGIRMQLRTLMMEARLKRFGRTVDDAA